jgi:hypothetical protein
MTTVSTKKLKRGHSMVVKVALSPSGGTMSRPLDEHPCGTVAAPAWKEA